MPRIPLCAQCYGDLWIEDPEMGSRRCGACYQSGLAYLDRLEAVIYSEEGQQFAEALAEEARKAA